MKKSFRLVFLLSVIILSACSSSDSVDPLAPMEQNVEGTVSISALNGLSGNDATAIVTFGNGQAAANYTTEAIAGDAIDYKINTSSANTEIRIINFRFNLAASTASFDDWESNFIVVTDTLSSPAKSYIEVNRDAANGDDYKFDIDFKVYVNGVSDGKIYYVDPKIRIKAKRFN